MLTSHVRNILQGGRRKFLSISTNSLQICRVCQASFCHLSNAKWGFLELTCTIGLTVGVTGQKGIITSPRHVISPIVYPGDRVCPSLYFEFTLRITWLVTVLSYRFLMFLRYVNNNNIQRDLIVVLKCKANTLPILMHQMRISTTKVSSVVLRPEKKLEVRK
jgi:hypothetical protein